MSAKFQLLRYLSRPLTRVIQQRELAVFTRQIATLAFAGLPLLRALEVMIHQERNLRFKAILKQIAQQLESGGSFSEGLAQHPKIFGKLYVNMVRAGELGGFLDVALCRIADFIEKIQRTKAKIKSAMLYPLVVTGVALAIVILLMIVVVPKFQSIFADMLAGATLPAPTRLVINISNSMVEHLLPYLLTLIVLFIAGKLFFKTALGIRSMSWCTLHTPKIRGIVRKVNIARMTRTLGALLSSGVPILQAIIITRNLTTNVYYSTALLRIHHRVRDGEALSISMEREYLFPMMLTSMVDVGEQSGALPEMLERIADNYEEDVDNLVAGVTAIIEPLMIVFLAIAVGFIVIALFLPIVEIIRQLT